MRSAGGSSGTLDVSADQGCPTIPQSNEPLQPSNTLVALVLSDERHQLIKVSARGEAEGSRVHVVDQDTLYAGLKRLHRADDRLA